MINITTVNQFLEANYFCNAGKIVISSLHNNKIHFACFSKKPHWFQIQETKLKKMQRHLPLTTATCHSANVNKLIKNI